MQIRQDYSVDDVTKTCSKIGLYNVANRSCLRFTPGLLHDECVKTRTAATTTRGPETQPHASVFMALPLQLLLLMQTRRELVLR